MQANKRFVNAQTRIIQDYQRQNRSVRQKIEIWKAERVNRNVAMFLGLVAGALLTNVVWIIGFNWFVLGG